MLVRRGKKFGKNICGSVQTMRDDGIRRVRASTLALRLLSETSEELREHVISPTGKYLRVVIALGSSP